MNWCTKCEKHLTDNHFRMRHDRGVLRKVCRKCENSINLNRYHIRDKTKEAHRRASYKYSIKQYGLSIEQYEELVKSQESKCLICNEYQERLHVDHDHKTGKVRGLLCHSCNVALGHVKDSPEILEKMIDYLKQTVRIT